MKPKSVAGLFLYVKDVKKSADFYETLGFTVETREEDFVKVRLNWFWIDLFNEQKVEFKKEAEIPNRGSGMFVYLSVDDVDEFYKGVINAGLKPSSEPRDWEWGNREFVIRDPDGFKLVFFKKLK